MIEIKHRYTGAVIWSGEVATVREAVVKCVESGIPLSGANLRGADLSDADLSRANLSRANLSRADLSRANLSRAYLSDADLSRAYLSDADLSDANLSGGITFAQYLAEVVPALLTAGGKSLADVLATGCWECHSWTNCPMAVAFGVDELSKVPPLYRAEASRFVQFFDLKLIPKPELPESR